MANDINKEDPHYKGDYGSIYEVNRKFPTGGVAGDFVVIDGWAHYWNADRGTWCVNAERDSYWDELITNIIEKFKLVRGATYMGVASLNTEPAKAIGAKMYYFATVAGTYKNFDNLVVPQGINVLYSENGSSWVNTTLLEVAQELGVSTNKVVSQKTLNDALNLKANQSFVNEALAKKADNKRVDDELAKKFDKASVVQEFGDSEDKVVSQFALPFREIESPQFIKAIVDAEDHFLFGIQLDGSIEWGKGIPAPIRAKLQEIINQCQQDKTDILEAINAAKKELSASIAVLQEGKVDKEEGKSLIEDEVKECFKVIENEEFIHAVIDSEGRLLFGIYRDSGKPYFPQNDMYHISQSEEFLWVILDAANHPLLGIQQDGTCWAAKAQWLDDIKAIKEALSSIDETLKTFQPKEDGKGLINLDVADSFFYISNDEYIIAVVDREDRILAGIKYDAQPYFPNHEMYSVVTNEEWLYAIIDEDDKVLCGFRANDGHMIVGGIDISTFISDGIIDISDIRERTAHLSIIDNDEYLSVEIDADGKVIGYTAPDGSHYLYKVKSETIPTEFSHIEDPEGRTEITTDAEGNILGYRDSEGTRHEYKLHVNSLSLSSQGLSDFEQKLKESGFISGQGDWSEKSSLQIAEPRCAIINITSSDDKKAEWAVSKSDNKKYWMQFFDMNGNYFKKRIIFNAQGNSSMAFKKRNGAIDICNDKWIGDDTFSLKIGNWVAQDSFHLKAYYFDFFKGAGVVSYKIVDEVDKTRPFYVNKPWKKAYIKDIYRDNDSIGSPNATEHLDNLSLQIDNGARCVPDGFPCIVYLNGDFYGVYAFCLKKHRDNYHMDKSVASNIHLDGDLNKSTLFGGSISWGSFEIRNPKNLVYKTPIKSFIPNDKDSLSDAFLYDADKAQAEIAGDVNIQAYDSSKQYSLGDYVTYNKKVFMAIASSQGVSPTASKKAKDVFKDAASNGNWIDITFTNTVKYSIQRLSNSMSDITSASVQSEKFEEYFDKENLIDYELVQCALHDVDSQGFNWQIITYDGNKWYFCNYDKERVFGQTGSFNMLSSVPTEGMFIIGSGKGTPNEWVINNCSSELKERWKQLVRLGIFTEEHIISLYNDWISRIGAENYKLEYKKWINSPCNRDSMVNISDWKYDGKVIASWINWDTFGITHSAGDYVKEGNKIYQALSDNVNKVPSQNPDVWKDVTYNSNKQYNPDDIVWQGVDDFFCFKCLKQTTGVAPISAFYDSYPRALGYHDNIWRLQSYISKNFEVMNKFINNIK